MASACSSNSPSTRQQRYGTELRNRTLASVRPEISQTLDSLLDQLHTSEEAKVVRSAPMGFGKPTYYHPSPRETPRSPRHKHPFKQRPTKSCPLCHQAGRPDFLSHFLSSCKYLPDSDRRFLSRVRQVTDIEDDLDYTDEHECEDNPPSNPQACCESDHSPNNTKVSRRMNVIQSPHLHAFFKYHPLRLTIDTGAETNMMKASIATYI